MGKVKFKPKTMKTVLYIHGFMSGSNSETSKILSDLYMSVIAPEVDGNVQNSLEKINKVIKETKPNIIIGSSLGGYYALLCDSGDIPVLVINPSLFPKETLKKNVGKELTYYSKREDGKKTYTLTQEDYDLFGNYDAIPKVSEKKKNLWAICSTKDEVLGDSHIKALEAIIPNRITKTDEIGHRLDKKFIKSEIALIVDNMTD